MSYIGGAVFETALAPFFDGYCSTVQGLLDWFEVDLGFTFVDGYCNTVQGLFDWFEVDLGFTVGDTTAL